MDRRNYEVLMEHHICCAVLAARNDLTVLVAVDRMMYAAYEIGVIQNFCQTNPEIVLVDLRTIC